MAPGGGPRAARYAAPGTGSSWRPGQSRNDGQRVEAPVRARELLRQCSRKGTDAARRYGPLGRAGLNQTESLLARLITGSTWPERCSRRDRNQTDRSDRSDPSIRGGGRHGWGAALGTPDTHKFVVNPGKPGKLHVGKFESPGSWVPESPESRAAERMHRLKATGNGCVQVSDSVSCAAHCASTMSCRPESEPFRCKWVRHACLMRSVTQRLALLCVSSRLVHQRRFDVVPGSPA